MNDKLWLIGSGVMSQEYARVLAGLEADFAVIGRGAASAKTFTEKTGLKVFTGGLSDYLGSKPEVPGRAIVSVGVEQLKAVTQALLRFGVRSILVEKPAGLNEREIAEVAAEAARTGASVYVAYNRRFYAATLKAEEIIRADGGLTSFNFEFTEWGHEIVGLNKPKEVKENWFLANSSHVVDLAFFLGGEPEELCAYAGGSLSWHPAASVFAGAGRTKDGVLFSYQANWEAPGRWGVEILTRKHRLIFRPMEQLHVQKIGSVAIEKVEIDDELDKKFKPGLFRQTAAFLGREADGRRRLLDIEGQLRMMRTYDRIVHVRPAEGR